MSIKMQTKTKQIVIIIILGLALMTIGFFGFMQIKDGDFSGGDGLGTRLVSGDIRLEDKQADDRADNVINNNLIKIDSNRSNGENKIGFNKKEAVPVPVPEIIKEKTVIKLTENIPQQQIRYDKNSVVKEGGYLKCLKEDRI